MSAPMLIDQSVRTVDGLRRTALAQPVHPSLMSVRIVRGRAALLKLRPMLVTLARRCNQPGTMANLEYFLSHAVSLRKTPHLLLVGPSDAEPGAEPTGAVFLFEYRMFGLGLRIFAPEDTTGRRCVIAPPELRAAVAVRACRSLMEQGALIVFAALQHDQPDPETIDTIHTLSPHLAAGGPARWSVRDRQEPTWLPLESTYDATLAHLGKKSRYSIKYFRRRAERELGATFVENVQLSWDEIRQFSRVCSYPAPASLLRWRYDMLKSTQGLVLCGVRDSNGRWLSILAARRIDEVIEVDWQMNRDDIDIHSLSLLARGYLIEYAITLGCTRLYMEGGTKHYIRNHFQPATITELTVIRNSAYARLIGHLAPTVTPSWNRLSQIVADPAVTWHLA